MITEHLPRAVLQASDVIGARITLIVLPVIEYTDVWFSLEESLLTATNDISPDTVKTLSQMGFAPYAHGFISSFHSSAIAKAVQELEHYFDFVVLSRSERNISPPAFVLEHKLPYRILFRERLYQFDSNNKLTLIQPATARIEE